MNCAIPLVTKYWEIDYGTLRSIPISGFIEKIHSDSDGIFTFYCKNGENGFFEWGLRNLTEKFDYTINFCGLYEINELNLNKSVNLSSVDLFNLEKMQYFVNQKFKISFNFFFYEKLASSETQKMRNFVQNYYNSIKTASTISTIDDSNILSKISAINISEFECDIVFYVDCLNPLQLKTSNIISVKDMAKTFTFSDGTKATICKMEFFMEESDKRYQFDEDALKLYQKFRSIDDYQICTACPQGSQVIECNIWQMNSNGYYLCSTCCLGVHQRKCPHNCQVPTEIANNKFLNRNSNGFCSRCLFYFRPSMAVSNIELMRKQPKSKMMHINYSAPKFFELLTFGICRPYFFDWNLENEIIVNQSLINETKKNTIDNLELAVTDIITIKDTVKLSKSIEELKLTDAVALEDTLKLLSNDKKEALQAEVDLNEWEFTNNIYDANCEREHGRYLLHGNSSL